MSSPPYSIPPVSTPPVEPASEPQSSEPAPRIALETLLLRSGLVTLEQLGAALREQTETGTPFAEVLVRDGAVRPEELARLAGPEPEPEPEPEREPVALAPAPEPRSVVAGYVVRGRLVNGDDVEIATVDDAEAAQRLARDAMRACARPDGADWPVLNGRYVRPESIVAIEVAEAPAP